MDRDTLARINFLIESVSTNIREWNQRKLEQRIGEERQVIDIKVQEAAEVKAAQLLAEEIKNNERLAKLEQQRIKWQRETVDYYKQSLFWAGVHLSRALPALVIISCCSAVGFGFGLFSGLNVLPSSVGCPSADSWCYQWRLNKESTVAPEKPSINKKRVAPVKKKLK